MLASGFFRLSESEMDDFEDQAPFMFAAAGLAIAAGRVGRAFPGENIVERPVEQRLFGKYLAHEGVRVLEVFAHVRVATVADGGCAMGLGDAI